MNNNRSFKSPLKFFAYSFILITGLFSIISCENFLQGEDVKEEIAKTIEYNNAPSYTINVEALKGTGIVKTPAGGEIEKKVTDVFPIRFEPEDSCKFIKWEAKFQSGESAADYVSFEDVESLETKVTFKKAPSSVIIIQPVCPPRLTYTFDLDGGEIYPRDSSIIFNFSQNLSTGSLVDNSEIIPDANEYIAIQNIEPGLSSSTYFKNPEISGKKIIFRADTSFGYIPVTTNGQRMISVRIPKEKIWYINEQYLNPIKVYLDADIAKTFYIGKQTSAQTKLKYDVKQKNETPIGILKVNGDQVDNKEHGYSVGDTISLRYQIPEGYTFKQWKFVDSNGDEFSNDALKLSISEEESTDRLILVTITIDNYMEELVTVVPEIYDPVNIEFVKGAEDYGVFKVDNQTLSQERQNEFYAVGSDLVFSLKVAEGFYFYDWSFSRTFKDENGKPKTVSILKTDLENYGLKLSYDDEADEKGYDKASRLAQLAIHIDEYTEDIISITPICFENLKVKSFNKADADEIYDRDSNIELSFNKALVTECKDKIKIKIPLIEEGKTSANYFNIAVLNQNRDCITIEAKRDNINELIPLSTDGTNTITITAAAEDLYYEETTPNGEKVKVGLADPLNYSYKINSQTSKKVKINYPDVEDKGVFKVQNVTVSGGQSKEYDIGSTFLFSFKPKAGYYFYGWEYECDEQSVSEELLKEAGINIKYALDEDSDERGYSKTNNIAQAQIIIEKAFESEILIKPVYYEYLKIEDFNNKANQIYKRDSSIQLTFNKPVTGIDNIDITIQGQNYKDYFDEPKLTNDNKTITFDSIKLLPLLLDGTNTIVVTIPKSEVYYEPSSEVKISLENTVSYSYSINSATSKTVKIRYSNEENKGSLKVQNVKVTDLTKDYDIGSAFEISYKLDEGYYFYGWEYKIGETVFSQSDLNELGIIIKDSEGEDSDGYDSSSRTALLLLTLQKYTPGEISIKPLYYEYLTVDFNNKDDISYERDSDILLTFNKPISEVCADKITINVPGMPSEKTYNDYFEAAELNGKTLLIKTKALLPIINGINTISVTIPLDEVYYEPSEDVKVGLESEVTYSYKINSESKNKTEFLFHAFEDDKQRSIVVDDVTRDGQKLEYSIEKSFVMKFKMSNDYAFKGWEFKHNYTDDSGAVSSKIYGPEGLTNEMLFDLNISLNYEDDSIYGYVAGNDKEGTAQVTVNINDYISGTIEITPKVEKIPVGKVYFEENNGKISSNNALLDTQNGIQVKYAETKQGDSNVISFSPDSAYEFIKWQIYNKANGTVIDNDNYIKIVNEGYESTSYILNAVPASDSGIQLAIKPIVAERPQILDYTPSGATLLRKDSTIQVLFDHDMDEDSIYYTDSELNQVNLLGTPLQSNAKPGKFYGYTTTTGKTYYKNISIKNNSNGDVLTYYYSEPVFDNPRTLTIVIDRAKLEEDTSLDYKQILVNVGKIDGEVGDGFFYKEDSKVVSMSGYKRWIYRTNAGFDSNPPTVDSISLTIGNYQTDVLTEPTVTHNAAGFNSLKYLPKNPNVTLNLSISDKETGGTVGSGLFSNFIISCERLYDGNYKNISSLSQAINYVVDYQINNTTAGNAAFNGNIPLTDLSDGIYGLRLIFKDQSGNESAWPEDGAEGEKNYYYFAYDKTAPFENVSTPVIFTEATDSSAFTLAWNESSYNDLKETKVEYKIGSGSYNTLTNIENESGKRSYSISTPEQGKRYDFKFTWKDYANNTYTYTPTFYTRPATPTNVVLSTAHGTSVTISGTKPSGATYSNIRIRYREKGTEDWRYTINVGSSDISGGRTISSLANGTKYEFEVCSYDVNSGKYSIPFKSGSEYPTFITTPAAVRITSASFNAYTNKGSITYMPPSSGDYTGIKFVCSSDSSFPSNTTTTKTDTLEKSQITTNSSGTTTKTFTELTPGTLYYSKVIAWYETEDNCVESSIWGPYSTSPVPVTNLNYTRDSNSITLTWNKPAGNYSSYVVSYKKISDSTWTEKTITDTNKSVTSYTITSLAAGTSYNAKIIAKSNNLKSTEVYMGGTSTSSVQLYPNVVTNFTVTANSSSETQVSWTKPAGTYTKLYLYESATSEGLSSATAIDVTDKTSYTFTGRSSATQYYYKVRSYISSSLYTDSDIKSCITDINPVVKGSFYGENSTTIRMYWSVPDNYDGIRIYRDGTLIKTITSSQMSSYGSSPSNYYRDTSLISNKLYSYTITSYKTFNDTEKTASVNYGSARTMAACVSNLTATVLSSSSIKLTWTNPSNTDYWVNTYIYKKKSGGSQELVSSWSGKTTTTYTVNNLDGGTLYTFYVKTSDASGAQNNAGGKDASTNLATASSISYTAAETSITLSWTKPSGSYDGIKIYKKLSTDSSYPSTPAVTVSNTATSASISSLSAANTYNFKVETYKTSFTSQSIEKTSCYTKTYAPALSVKSQTETSITVRLRQGYANGGTYVYYKKHSDSTYASKYTGNSSSGEYDYTISGLTPGVKYDFYATSWYGTSTNSSTSSIIYYVTDPAMPTGVSARAKEGNTIVSWNKTAGQENYFKVYYKKSSDSSWSDSGWLNGIGTTSNEFTNLTAGTKYDFKVISNYDYSSGNTDFVDGRDNMISAESSVFTFTTPPAPVTNLSIYQDTGMGRITIKYTPNASMNSVDIFVDGVATTSSVSSSSPMYYTFTIPNYKRSKSYTINVRSYHTGNSSKSGWYNGGENVYSGWGGETLSKSCTVTTSTSTSYITINGGDFSSPLINVVKSNSPVSISRNQGGGAFRGTTGKTITLTEYSIGKYEVIQAVFTAVMGANPSAVQGNLLPVTNVNWYAVMAFCNKFSVMQGLEPCYKIGSYTNDYWKTIKYSDVPTSDNTTWNKATYDFTKNGYHVPTEAQWEFAARGGSTSAADWNYTYSGSSTATAVGWMSSNSGGRMHDFGTKSPNRLGIYDMTGNAGEWLSDWYNSHPDNSYTDPYVQYVAVSGQPSSTGSYLYVIDSHINTDYSVKSRGTLVPYSANSNYGFRLCRNREIDK